MELILKKIDIKYGKNHIIKNIQTKIKGGDVVTIIGPNGAGKTTFLKAVAKLIKHSGIVELNDIEEEKLKESFTYVPQMSVNDIDLTVFEIVLLGQIKNLKWKLEEDKLDAVAKILKKLNLSHLTYHKFSSLSGGQKQMVVMAQALISNPKVLLLDEPTSALDLKHQLQIMELAKKYTKETGGITIIILHDIGLAARYSDEILLLHDGVLLQQGSPKNILDKELLGKAYDIDLEIAESESGFISIIPIKTRSKGE